MASQVFKYFLFALALLIATELTFRLYLFGVSSLNPVHMNSFTQIHHSGITQPASIPEIYFELKPNYTGTYKGKSFATNAYGQRDKSYSLTKPDNTFRVAVLGSSWTMGSGVESPEIWHSILEENLNRETSDDYSFEFINFGVDQYGMGELVATLENKVSAWQPDLVLVCITNYTPSVLWPDPPTDYIVQKQRNPVFDFWSVRFAASQLGLGLFVGDDAKRPSVNDPVVGTQQIARAMASFKQYSLSSGTPVVITKLAYTAKWQKKSDNGGQASVAAEYDIAYFDVLDYIKASGYKPAQLRVSKWDSHPNAIAHRQIAEAVQENLVNLQLLPVTAETAAPKSAN
jgi:hypothetical protein